jgi:hypothetical protein
MSQFDASETKIHLISQARPEAAVDVIFIHGLGGHFRTTWQADTASFWPEWLAEDVPQAWVWSAQYPADPAKWLGRGDSILYRLLCLRSSTASARLTSGNGRLS